MNNYNELRKLADSGLTKHALIATVPLGMLLGTIRAPRGHRAEGLGRGALRGAATSLGGYAGLGGGLALKTNPLLLGILGLLGGYGGFKLSGRALGQPSWEKALTSSKPGE